MIAVAPYSGAWIEMAKPSRKPGRTTVAPYSGAWIEMIDSSGRDRIHLVAPYSGAWIEISSTNAKTLANESHLIQVRGLKLANAVTSSDEGLVAPYSGAWIEIKYEK